MNTSLWLGGAFAVFLGGALLLRNFEAEAGRTIRAELAGDHRKVSVHVNTDLRTVSGIVPSVSLDASDFSASGVLVHEAPNGNHRGRICRLNINLCDFDLVNLHFVRLTAQIKNCRFDLPQAIYKRRLVIRSSERGVVEVQVALSDLKAFALKKFKLLTSAEVSYEDSKVKLVGTGNVLGLPTTVVAEGQAAILDGTRLVIKDAAYLVNGKVPDASTAKWLDTTLNPILDLNKDLNLENSIHFDSIEAKGDTLIGRGSVIIPTESESKVPQ